LGSPAQHGFIAFCRNFLHFSRRRFHFNLNRPLKNEKRPGKLNRATLALLYLIAIYQYVGSQPTK
jgi:hypothetical protein